MERLAFAGRLARVEHHEEIGSTQDRARQLAGDPLVGLPVLVVADRQTAGRGRGTNQWWTGEGSLALSIALDPESMGLSRDRLWPISLCGAVAVIDAVGGTLAGHSLGLLWPNDVVCGARKLCGILVEAYSPDRTVIGIGINVNNRAAEAPPALRAIVTSLADLCGRPIDRGHVLESIVMQFLAQLQDLAADPENTGRKFDEYCQQRGRWLEVEQGGRRVAGLCTGIATDGALVLECASGRQRVYSGTVVKKDPS
jgi:BirA family biotin operon repressor/biotin-[acetyl-CoA-carboxylase] ligase